MDAEVAVVGGGPGGMAAALAARECGASVMLLDEYPRLGGQFYKRAAGDFALTPAQRGAEHPPGEALRARVAESGVEVLSDTLVWGSFGKTLMIHRGGESRPIRAGAIVLATGAYDRPVAFPGWTLPGVMSAGGAQSLARTQWVRPGTRFLIAGAGPFAMPVAEQVLRAGATIVAMVEATRPIEWVRHAGAMWGQWPRFREAFAYRRKLVGIPVLYGRKIVRAIGERSLEAVEIAPVDREWRAGSGALERFTVDAVATAYGFLPNVEVADGCGCTLRWDDAGEAWFVAHDAHMATSVAGIYAAGEITGIAGSAVALAEGRIAGTHAAAHVGRITAADAARRSAGAVRERAHLMRFAAALNECFGPRPGLWEGLADGTMVCRCEDVTAADVRACAAGGSTTVKGVKDWTRAGMGPCQGRVCRNLVAQILAAATGAPLAQLARPRVRPPYKPVPFAALAESAPP